MDKKTAYQGIFKIKEMERRPGPILEFSGQRSDYPQIVLELKSDPAWRVSEAGLTLKNGMPDKM